ncbi:hypothetical protein QJQ45_028700 [Haematococcus lacustris]|nr:hypothetical protein QJQ45_028700 [Haematococcus lacustris]
MGCRLGTRIYTSRASPSHQQLGSPALAICPLSFARGLRRCIPLPAATTAFSTFHPSLLPGARWQRTQSSSLLHSTAAQPLPFTAGTAVAAMSEAGPSVAAAPQSPPDMQLPSSFQESYIALAHDLADVAARITSKYFRAPFDVEMKADASPVTIADREAEAAMRALLAQRVPSHAVFGEEQGVQWGSGAGAEFMWVLDPIDGTKSFITGGRRRAAGAEPPYSSSLAAAAGKPLFGTLIALLHQGQPVLGIIDQPISRERWQGVRGRPTTLNGRPLATRPCADLRLAYLYATTPHMFSGQAGQGWAGQGCAGLGRAGQSWAELGRELGRAAPHAPPSMHAALPRLCLCIYADDGHAATLTWAVCLQPGCRAFRAGFQQSQGCSADPHVRSGLCVHPSSASSVAQLLSPCAPSGCDCYAYGLLAAGHADIVCEADLKPYDYMALVPIVQGAGGVITDWRGGPLVWLPSAQAAEKAAAGEGTGALRAEWPGEVLAAGDPRVHQQALEKLAF